jgi:hypothetical protein
VVAVAEETVVKIYLIPEEMKTEEDRKRGNKWILTICHPDLVGCVTMRVNEQDLKTIREVKV